MKLIKDTWGVIKDYFTSDKRIFAKGLCPTKLFLIFVIGCVVGTYYEQILTLVTHYLENGSIVWESRRGVIYGPISPIYGAGAVLMSFLLIKKPRKWYINFLYASLLGGIFEYLVSFLQETFVGTISWDYSNYFLNINGRTTIPYMLAWGLAGMLLIYKVYPFLSRLIEKIPYLLGELITDCLIIFLIIDMTISWTALIRQNLRRMGYPPMTPVGKMYDTVYTDSYLKKYYPNMEVKK